MRWVAASIAALGAMLAAFALVGPASASPPVVAPTDELSTNTVSAGESLQITLRDFHPNPATLVAVCGMPVTLATATTGAAGMAASVVTGLSRTRPGHYRICGTDAQGKTASARLAVTGGRSNAQPSGSGGSPALIGVAVIGIGVIGALLLVGGFLALLASRRRRRAPARRQINANCADPARANCVRCVMTGSWCTRPA